MFGRTLRRRDSLLNAGLIVGVIVMSLVLVPSTVVVPAFGGFGHPATLLCLFLFAVWVFSRLHYRLIVPGAQPMRWLAWLCLAAAFASYAGGLWRGLTPAQDDLSLRTLLASLGFFGVVLATADGIRSKERLTNLICVMLVGAGVMALLGLVWAFTGWPGGWQVTPELGAVMVLMLPFAIHMGRYGHSSHLRQWMAVTGLVMVLTLATALSSAALVALTTMLVVLIPAWNWRMRFNLLAPILLVVAAVTIAVPGLPSNVTGLFAEPGHDVVALAAGRWAPVPENLWPAGQWEVGLIALALLHVGGFVLAAMALSRSVTYADRNMCSCLMATQLIAIALGLSFAPLSVGAYAVFSAIVTGACGVMWRLTTPRLRRLARDV